MTWMNTDSPHISIIVPVYKEDNNIKPFLQRLEVVLSAFPSYEILFCLDPSPDNTEAIIYNEIERNNNIKLLVFSRRFGQTAATMAGLLHCKGKAAVVMTVNLQDPPELILPMYTKIQAGYEVVYAQCKSRKSETLLKRLVSHFNDKVINKFSDITIPQNTSDFRIMTRRVLEEIRGLNESHHFLHGLVAYVGFKQTFVEYDRDERFSKQDHNNRFFGSMKINLNRLISFSNRPLQFISIAGAIIAGFSFTLGLWYLFQKLAGVSLTSGLSTTVLAVSFFSGVQLLCLGLMGEYIGRIFDEVKRRPMFIIDKIITKTSQNADIALK